MPASERYAVQLGLKEEIVRDAAALAGRRRNHADDVQLEDAMAAQACEGHILALARSADGWILSRRLVFDSMLTWKWIKRGS